MTPEPTGQLVTRHTTQGYGKQCNDNRRTRGKQPPYTFGKFSVALVSEQAEKPAKCLTHTSPHYCEELFS